MLQHVAQMGQRTLKHFFQGNVQVPATFQGGRFNAVIFIRLHAIYEWKMIDGFRPIKYQTSLDEYVYRDKTTVTLRTIQQQQNPVRTCSVLPKHSFGPC